MLVRSLLGLSAAPTAMAGRPGPFDDYWYRNVGQVSSAGVPVSADSALKISAVWACVRILSSSVAQLPLHLYARQADGGRRRASDEPLYDLLHDAPNHLMIPFTFKQVMMLSLLLRGNAYAEIQRDSQGDPIALWPLFPDRVKLEELAGHEVRYRYQESGVGERIIQREDMFHLLGLSHNGLSGLSLVAYAREVLGLTLAAEQYAAGFFGRGAMPGGALKHKGTLSDGAAKRLRESWKQLHGGTANSHRMAILEEGMEWQTISFSAEDAQLIASRQFQIADVARLWGVPLHMLQEETKSTSWGAGIEQLSIGFVTFTLMAYLVSWEETASVKLLTQEQRRRLFWEFLVDGLLRADSKSRAEALQIQRQNGALTGNEWRSLENRNPEPGGEYLVLPLNYAPAEQLGRMALPTDPSGPRPAPDDASARAELPDLAGQQRQRAMLSSLVIQTSEHLARRETAALAKLARRLGADTADWPAQVAVYYAEHGADVADRLSLAPEYAEWYATRQANVLREWGADFERIERDWLAQTSAYLSGLVLSGLGLEKE